MALAALGDATLAEPQRLVPAVTVRRVLHLDEDQVASPGIPRGPWGDSTNDAELIQGIKWEFSTYVFDGKMTIWGL